MLKKRLALGVAAIALIVGAGLGVACEDDKKDGATPTDAAPTDAAPTDAAEATPTTAA